MTGTYIWIIFCLASKYALIILRGIFGFWQNIFWSINGTSSHIQKSYKESSYKRSVQVLNVLLRYKYDLCGQPSGPELFIASHDKFVDPEYVLDYDEISLLSVDKDKAIWVQVDKGVDISRSVHAAFIYIAQYRLAKKLIIMPMHVFHKLGKKVGKPKAKLILLSNTARCGSTLLTRVFSETQTCIAFAEPFSLSSINFLRGVVSDEERYNIFINCINLLCKPLKSRDIKAFVLKPTQTIMVELPSIKRLFPSSYQLFIYRDGFAVANSIAKCTNRVLNLAIMQIIGRWSSKATKNIMVASGHYASNFEAKLKSDLDFGTIMWAAAIRQYLDFREAGLAIAAARYEDMIKDPKFAFRKIFEYCELPFDLRAVELGMSQDAHRGSPLSLECLKNYKSVELTSKVKMTTDKICDEFQVPRFGENFIAPGTITAVA